MAKVSVAQCDHCMELDTEDNPVRRVTVSGVSLDLCADVRMQLLTSLGVHTQRAAEVVEMQNRGETRSGKPPRPEQLRGPSEGSDDTEPAQVDGEPDGEPEDLVQTVEDARA